MSLHKQRRGHAWRSAKFNLGRLHFMATVAAPGFGYRWAFSLTVGPRYLGVQGTGHDARLHRA